VQLCGNNNSYKPSRKASKISKKIAHINKACKEHIFVSNFYYYIISTLTVTGMIRQKRFGKNLFILVYNPEDI